MKLTTLYFGEIVITKDDILTFDNGLPGFQEYKQFVLLDLEGNPAFKVLQSINQENLAFIVTNPFLIEAKYEFKLDQSTKQQLYIEEPNDVQVWNIVTVQDPFERSTVNLKGPIVINVKHKKENNYCFQNSIIRLNLQSKEGSRTMLVLTRKIGESIQIGDDIEVKVVSVNGDQIKLGIEAPKHIDIHRSEIYQQILQENRNASKIDIGYNKFIKNTKKRLNLF